LSWPAARLETKESRRKALSRLDYLLEQLERANLAELRNPPSGVVRELIEGGLSNAMTNTIPQLIEIVFNSQELLMRGNRTATGLAFPTLTTTTGIGMDTLVGDRIARCDQFFGRDKASGTRPLVVRHVSTSGRL
jgi:hypothetical protein